MGTREEIHSDLAVAPGEFLLEVLKDLGMTQADLAGRMGRPAQAINEMVKGSKALTPETALQLEQVVGVPAHIWLGLEAEYRLVNARQVETERVKAEAHLLPAFPYRDMVSLGCIEAVRAAEDKVRELRRFFGVASLEQLGAVPAYAPAFRLGALTKQPSPYGLAAWLQCGLLQARAATSEPFDRSKLRAALPALRALTMATADDVVPQLRTRLAECGVVFALFQHFPKTYAHGATFWVDPGKKAVVLVSTRGKWADIFWFSFFHELGHIILHGNATFVEMDAGAGLRTPEEEEADGFAQDTLIPSERYAAWVAGRDFTAAALAHFAASLGIHPGIVVGRLQHEKLLPPDRSNGLRERYCLTSVEHQPAA